MEDAKVGGAKDSAGRPVSKLLISSSHAVAKDHGSFTYEVPNNDQIHCESPCYVGVSDLQVPVFGPAMADVVHGVNDKLYYYVATTGSSPPTLSYHIITVPPGQYSASALAAQIQTKTRCSRRPRRRAVQRVLLQHDESDDDHADIGDGARIRHLRREGATGRPGLRWRDRDPV